MKKLTDLEIKEILRLHKLWLAGEEGGVRATQSGTQVATLNIATNELGPKDMAVHTLKTEPEYMDMTEAGVKFYEIRKDDRGFQVRDTVFLREWSNGKYLGREKVFTIASILRNAPGLMPGYCILNYTLPDVLWYWNH